MKILLFFLCGMLLFIQLAFADAVKDREGAVRDDRARMENDPRWVFNDVEKGFEESKKTGKPLLVVLRCVPCLSCMGMDAAVLSDASLGALLDQFVCVRLINANALDLNLFQMETDLSLSAMIFHPDRTVYARFGSWRHQRDPLLSDLEGFKATLTKALVAHKGYPANQSVLTGKQPKPSPFKSPVEIPLLAEKYKTTLDWEGKVVGSCVHCHMIGDAYRTWYRTQGQPVPDEWLFPYPEPESIGITLGEDGVQIMKVAAGSAADTAGIKVGEVLEQVAGQTMYSAADLAWALHQTPNSKIEFAVKTNAATRKLALPAQWKELATASQRVGVWSMRGMALGGLSLIDLTDEERAAKKLPSSGMALFAKGLGQYGKHGTAKKAGFQKEDVIVALDGITERKTEAQVLAHLLRHRLPGQKVSVTLLRNDKQLTLDLPMQ